MTGNNKQMKTGPALIKKHAFCIPVGTDSRFLCLRKPTKSAISSKVDEGDGPFVKCGMFSDSLPYTMNDYDLTENQNPEFDCAVLENDFLRAEFIPAPGGWFRRLYDKVQKRDSLNNNTGFLPPRSDCHGVSTYAV